MAHEVIMPALGMAQDSGVIVSWLKEPGAAVKAGEPLFEVETDKATMEVEAGQDGWLSVPRYVAGDEVAVGAVIAHIAESAEAAEAAGSGDAAGGAAPDASTDTGGDAPTDGGGAGGSDALPAGTAVIMPALGMAQDSGVLLGWLKEPGAAVKAGEPLFEVETDKASMEVEAGQDGYLAAVLAAPGDEVPVGRTIAVIADAPPATPLVRALGDAPDTPAAPDTTAATDTPPTTGGAVEGGAMPPETGRPATAAPGKAAHGKEAPAHADGRILASPKARRLARERGLDLSRLVRMGVAQPYHVADLETLEQAGPETMTGAAGQTEAAGVMAGGRDLLEAEAPAAPLAGLLDWLATQTAAAVPRATVLAAFAAAALRRAQDCEAAVLHVLVAAPSGAVLYRDPDLAGLAHAAPVEPGADGDGDIVPDLILRDLTATRLSRARFGRDGPAPVLTLGPAPGDRVRATLTFAPGALPEDAAIALLDGFAGRFEEPLRHLL